MQIEIDNVKDAWEWTIEQGQAERLEEGIEGLGLFYAHQTRYREGVAALRALAHALAAGNTPRSPRRLRFYALALAHQAWLGEWTNPQEQNVILALRRRAILEEVALTGEDVRRESVFVLRVLGPRLTQRDDGKGAKSPFGNYAAAGVRLSMM
jgi:hypothetical protein